MIYLLPNNYISYFLIKNEYINLFFTQLHNHIKINFIKHFYHNNKYIKFYVNSYLFYIKKLPSIQVIDFIQKYEYFFQIIIPSIFKIKNKCKYKNFLFYNFPLCQYQGLFIVNGIKRILLPHLTQSESLKFVKISNNNSILYLLNILFSKYNIYITIEFNKNTKNILFIFKKLNIKFNLIHLLYFLNINNTFITKVSLYGTSILLKKILYNASKTYNSINIKNFIKLFKKLFNFNIVTYILLTPINSIKNLVKLIDLILDFSLTKKYYYSDPFCNKHINISVSILFNFINIHINWILSNITSLIYHTQFSNINIFNLYKEFLLINPLFRILEEINILSELSNLYKIIHHNFNTTSIIIRDFKINQINMLCPLHTAEGPSSGLILSKIFNNFYNHVNNKTLTTYYNLSPTQLYKNLPITLTTNKQEQFKIILTKTNIKKLNYFNKFLLPTMWYYNINFHNINTINTLTLEIADLLGPSENLIPFIFFTDPTRSLMGAKMQTQSIPILGYNYSLIFTGYEKTIIYNSDLIYALQEGIVTYVSSFKIKIRDILNREITYYLNKYKLTNQITIKSLTPLVWVGERISIGQLLVTSTMSRSDELVLGTPLKLVYGSYFGYDYEDSLIISQRLLYNHIFSSIHIHVYTTSYQFITSQNSTYEYSSIIIPNTSLYFKRHLNSYGILKEGSRVIENDIIISKLVNTKIINNKFNVYCLINLLFGKKLSNIINFSIKNTKNTCGRVLKIELFIHTYLFIRVFIGNIRLLEIGDKLCGRHGNKGIISYISKNVDMPYTLNGEFPDLITGSLGIPSRMNLGQLYEGLFGISNFYLNTRFLFHNIIDHNCGINYLKYFLYENLQKSSTQTSYKNLFNPNEPGKIKLRDGRSGDNLKGTLCLGVVQYFKLIHMIKDKVQCRSVGSYTNITQQPVRGKARQGGQRFGEMEVWSLEAFGAAYSLRELLSSRSDDIQARSSLNTMLINNKEILTKTHISEPFKLILKELASLALNINISVIYSTIHNKIKNYLI